MSPIIAGFFPGHNRNIQTIYHFLSFSQRKIRRDGTQCRRPHSLPPGADIPGFLPVMSQSAYTLEENTCSPPLTKISREETSEKICSFSSFPRTPCRLVRPKPPSSMERVKTPSSQVREVPRRAEGSWNGSQKTGALPQTPVPALSSASLRRC